MLFNSIDFAIFLPVVFLLYWAIGQRSLKAQNLLIVASSYLFYGWWDWRFLSLIGFSTAVDYLVGLGLENEDRPGKRKLLLWLSMITNLGFLGFFKYYHFFLDNFISAFSLFGVEISGTSLNIILPVGISFYTFQSMSYTIDVYRGKLKPTRDLVAFTAFVCFFPQLVAGPIERATHLLPQFQKHRYLSSDGISSGLKMMLWGLFMKVVVADRLAIYVNDVYGDILMHSGATLFVATVFFAIQIYCDFGGYSLIAIGTARLFGFDLMTNFNRPYLSSSFREFWSRWHISLSTWFRDYVYIPLGGNREGKARTNFNLLATFLISGFWHGANWTFIVWGALHGVYQIAERTFSSIRLPKPISIAMVFCLTNLAWVFFRARSVDEATMILHRIFTVHDIKFYMGDIGIFAFSILAVLFLFAHDVMMERFPQIRLFNHQNMIVRYASLVFICVYILTLGVFDRSQFIYFQF